MATDTTTDARTTPLAPPPATARTTGDHRDDVRIERPSNGPAVAAIVTGMLATTLAFLVIGAPGAVVLGLAAIILGAIGVKRAKAHGGLLKGTAITGIVTGVLGLLLGAAVIVGSVTLFNQVDTQALQDEVDQLQQEVDGDVLGG